VSGFNRAVRAARYWSRRELRRRWRAAILLIALVGLAGGTVLVAVAGARRSSTAYDRFRRETLAADLEISREGPPSGSDEELRAAIERLPQVEAVAHAVYPFIVPAGSGLYPYLDFLAFADVDGNNGTTIDRPRMVEGRLPREGRADEMAVLERFAREARVGVGDRVEFDSFAPAQLEPLFTTGDAGRPAGPRVALRITGIVDAPSFISESVGSFQPRVFLSSTFYRSHAEDVAAYPGGYTVRLTRGTKDVPAVVAAIRRQFGDDPTLEMQPASEIDDKVDSSIDVVVGALLLSAAVAGLAGAVLTAQALGRHFAHDVFTDQWLAVLGMTRRERVAAVVLTALPVVTGGAAIAVVGSVLASPLMPVGIARRAEPDPGVAIDGWVLALGFIAVAVAVFGLAVLAAFFSTARTPVARMQDANGRPSRQALLLERANLPPAASVGVGMALDPRSGTIAAVRSAIVAVALGAMGVMAVVVFATSLGALVGSSERYGAPWDAIVSGFSGDIDEIARAVSGDANVDRVAVLASDLGRIGDAEGNLFALEPRKGSPALTLLDGRSPRAPGEVAVGASTMREAGLHLGDKVAVVGGGGRFLATVVGRAAFPVIDERSSAGRGVLATTADLMRIATEETLNRDLVVAWTAGFDRARAVDALGDRFDAEVSAPLLPSDVNNLRDVEALPRVIGVLLAVLATLAVVHALVATVRFRRHDLAVLRALGFERAQLGGAIAWQATTIVAIGAVVGLPIGTALGRLIWRQLADGIGVVDRPVVPLLVATLVALATVVIGNLAAAVPARRAARVSTAATLRTS
jgi:predicted lysophospholipase L1 biosynthesis ABC-type transport system permease subunit